MLAGGVGVADTRSATTFSDPAVTVTVPKPRLVEVVSDRSPADCV